VSRSSRSASRARKMTNFGCRLDQYPQHRSFAVIRSIPVSSRVLSISAVPDVCNYSRIIGKCHLRTRNPDTRTGIAARCARHLDRARTISPGSRGHAEGRRGEENGGTRRDPSGVFPLN
jgi:hypothetical protein